MHTSLEVQLKKLLLFPLVAQLSIENLKMVGYTNVICVDQKVVGVLYHCPKPCQSHSQMSVAFGT